MFLQPLEARSLFAARAPSNLDQFVIELVNRARADPVAEAARFGITLNEGLPAGTISTAPKQPVAVNPNLTDALHSHVQWIFDNDIFSHTGAGGSSPEQRAAAAGYSFTGAPTYAAENLGLVGGSLASDPLTSATSIHRNLFTDETISNRWHRRTILDEGVRELGAALGTGSYGVYNAAILGHLFAVNTGDPRGDTFVTGVAYTDATSVDRFYTVGEGLGGVNVSARRVSDSATFSTTTYGSGGYSIRLSPGTYDLTASGPGFASPGTRRVVVGEQNVKVDFIPGADTAPPTVVSAAFESEVLPNRLVLTFSENVATSLVAGDVLIRHLGTGTPVAVSNLTYDPASNRATFFLSGVLPDGVYRATLAAGTVQDAAGNPIAAPFSHDFTFLSGDANRDRSVDIADFAILAARFNLPGTFSQGDFNYNGTTEIGDFAILASKFNTALPAASAERGSTAAGGLFAERAASGDPRLIDEVGLG